MNIQLRAARKEEASLTLRRSARELRKTIGMVEDMEQAVGLAIALSGKAESDQMLELQKLDHLQQKIPGRRRFPRRGRRHDAAGVDGRRQRRLALRAAGRTGRAARRCRRVARDADPRAGELRVVLNRPQPRGARRARAREARPQSSARRAGGNGSPARRAWRPALRASGSPRRRLARRGRRARPASRPPVAPRRARRSRFRRARRRRAAAAGGTAPFSAWRNAAALRSESAAWAASSVFQSASSRRPNAATGRAAPARRRRCRGRPRPPARPRHPR